MRLEQIRVIRAIRVIRQFQFWPGRPELRVPAPSSATLP